jgi:hypothetical protein
MRPLDWPWDWCQTLEEHHHCRREGRWLGVSGRVPSSWMRVTLVCKCSKMMNQWLSCSGSLPTTRGMCTKLLCCVSKTWNRCVGSSLNIVLLNNKFWLQSWLFCWQIYCQMCHRMLVQLHISNAIPRCLLIFAHLSISNVVLQWNS